VSKRIAALAALLDELKKRGYSFVTPTPATHARVIARETKQTAKDLRDIFGWSLPFAPELIDPELMETLRAADVLEARGAQLRSLVRVSQLHNQLFLHSAFPTTRSDSVFLGPDSYRFADFLHETLPAMAPRAHVVDIGAGSGIGGIIAARLLRGPAVTLTDINPAALDLARANCLHAEVKAELIECDTLAGVTSEPDVIIANPPYIADPAHRAYRDGGGLYGGAVSVRWAADAARRLPSRGAFALYTGTAVVNGEHVLQKPLLEALTDCETLYGEIDPDVFGEELEREDYADVERIAVIGVVAVKR
jgi:methylase of polypeptide subunit release factors